MHTVGAEVIARRRRRAAAEAALRADNARLRAELADANSSAEYFRDLAIVMAHSNQRLRRALAAEHIAG